MTATRTCVVTRAELGRDEGLRLALGPDGAVYPDLRGRFPGRGAWVTISAEAIGGLSRVKGRVEQQLGGRLDVDAFVALAREGALVGVRDGIGLAARAGALVFGADTLARELEGGRIEALVFSDEASERTITDLRAAAARAEQAPPFVRVPWSTELLGHAVGRGLAAAVGLPGSRVNDGVLRLLRLIVALG